jgi:hypothetical protein
MSAPILRALFDYLVEPGERLRAEAVRRFSANSVFLMSQLEERRALGGCDRD